MTDATAIPESAHCRTCGYSLRGLIHAVCPECGRVFDPEDPRTYDADPRRTRRRRWTRRLIIVVPLLMLAAAFAPRGLFKADAGFTCAKCGHVVSVTRAELKPPEWLGVRYPGLHWRSERPGGTGPSCPPGTHAFDYKLRFDLRFGGWAAGSGTLRKGTTVNGQPFSIDTVPKTLKHLLSPGTNGIGP